jgi:hypothetical protein
MKTWHWDDPDPRMVWDNPNLRWGEPGYLLEPGDPGYVELQPGQPGYVPPISPVPKPRTYHRSTMDIPTQMEFTFITKLTTAGEKFTTRPAFGPSWTHDELDGLVHAKYPDVPAATCRAIGKQYFMELLCADSPRRCLRLFDLLYVRPSSGGNASTRDGFANADDIKADMIVGYLSEVIRDWREKLTMRNTGSEGAAIPVIEAVLDEANGGPNHYTAMQNVRLVGVNLDFDKTQADQGVFIAPAAGGPWVRLSTYGPITKGQIYVLIPSGTTGAQKLRVVDEGGHEGFSGEITDA